MAPQDRFHGLLIIDKPAGWTSHDVVGRVRRLLGQRSVGHAGTLDPAATGVLPVAVGSALRSLAFLSDATKSYRAEVTFGVRTDTLDGEGRMTGSCAIPHLSRDAIDDLLSGFVGAQQQFPPVYSAIKVGGTRLYEHARKGEFVELEPRSVTIQELNLLEWNSPELTMNIDCSKGFYVRSFARDLGERVGSCAYLSNLVRTRVASFTLCDAWTLAELSDAPLVDEWETIAIAPDAPAFSLPTVIIDHDQTSHWNNGKRMNVDASIGDGPVRVYDSGGDWVGIGELAVNDGSVVLKPRKVIPAISSIAEEPR